MSSNPSAAPSLARTGLRAGASFAASVAKGAVLSLVLGCGVFFFYLSQLDGPGVPAARAGGAGAIVALLSSPPLLVAILLLGFVPLYMMLGVARGRTLAMRQVVASRGDVISQKLGDAIADRIEAMPRTHGTLQRTAEWLSPDALCRQLAPVLGEGKAVRAVVGFVLRKLPMSEMLAEWQATRTEQPEAADGALRSLLTRRIGETLEDMSTPSRRPLYIALAAHGVLLGVGLWLVR